LPLVTAGITAFYMARMWFMTFAGKPRDEHVYEHAHESPWLMTVPLIVLAAFSIVVAWGLPPWQAHESFIGRHGGLLQVSEPVAVLPELHLADAKVAHIAEDYHEIAGALALGIVALGILFAALMYLYRVLDPAESKEQFPAVYRFLCNKWYFDELYSATVVRPSLVVARWFNAIDLWGIDVVLHSVGRATIWLSWLSGRFDAGIVDGLVNLCGNVIYGTGRRLRDVQTGYIRSYVLFLVLAAVGLFLLLSWFVTLAVAR
jgi:NADH-quinone oxidoreductase subunit L